MSLGRGLAFSLFFAALGGAAWTAAGVVVEMRLGWLGIFVGGLAGFGMSLGNKARGGAAAGFLAAVVAALGIVGSRYAERYIAVDRFLRAGAADISAEEAILQVAGDVQQEYMAQGIAVELDEDGDYSPVVYEEAQSRWDALSAEQQQAYMHDLGVHYASQGRRLVGPGAMHQAALHEVLAAFGLYGLIWLGLGVGTAYQIGCMRGEGELIRVGPDQDTGGGFWGRSAAATRDPDDNASTDPLAALGAGMRAEMAADRSNQFRPAGSGAPRAAGEGGGAGQPGAAAPQVARADGGGREAA